MANWTATTTTKATPEQVLDVLTHPDEIRRWSPVDFDVDELDAARLAPGTRARVPGARRAVSRSSTSKSIGDQRRISSGCVSTSRTCSGVASVLMCAVQSAMTETVSANGSRVVGLKADLV